MNATVKMGALLAIAALVGTVLFASAQSSTLQSTEPSNVTVTQTPTVAPTLAQNAQTGGSGFSASAYEAAIVALAIVIVALLLWIVIKKPKRNSAWKKPF